MPHKAPRNIQLEARKGYDSQADLALVVPRRFSLSPPLTSVTCFCVNSKKGWAWDGSPVCWGWQEMRR